MPWAPSMPSITALRASGEKVFKKKCKACHTVAQGGKQKLGPNLFGIMGAKAGATDFAKYKKINSVDVVWDEASMAAFLANPDAGASASADHLIRER